jgi:hypothetical protein
MEKPGTTADGKTPAEYYEDEGLGEEAWNACRDEMLVRLLYAFVQGGKFWQHHTTGATAFPSERDIMVAEAEKRLESGDLGESTDEMMWKLLTGFRGMVEKTKDGRCPRCSGVVSVLHSYCPRCGSEQRIRLEGGVHKLHQAWEEWLDKPDGFPDEAFWNAFDELCHMAGIVEPFGKTTNEISNKAREGKHE